MAISRPGYCELEPQTTVEVHQAGTTDKTEVDASSVSRDRTGSTWVVTQGEVAVANTVGVECSALGLVGAVTERVR